MPLEILDKGIVTVCVPSPDSQSPKWCSKVMVPDSPMSTLVSDTIRRIVKRLHPHHREIPDRPL